MAFVGRGPTQPYDATRGDSSGTFNYMPALDGWRAISILLVLVSHGGLGHIVPGGLGVTIFFFISGYLITSLLIIELRSYSEISLGKFCLRRFWRLSPPVIIYITLSSGFIFLKSDKLSFNEVFSSIFYFANYYSIYWHYESLPFAPSPLKILWSLAIEEQYYLIFAPLLAYFFKSQNKIFLLIFFLILTPLLVRVFIVFGNPDGFVNDGYTYMATEARIDSIAWGAAFAWICSRYSSGDISKYLGSKVTLTIAVLIIVFSLLFRDDRFRESIRYSLQGMALIPIFHATLHEEYFLRTRNFLSNKILVLIGKLSYSIYLYHWLALVLTSWIIGSTKLAPVWLATYYGLSIILATFSYILIEVPSLTLRKKYGSHVAA